MIGVCDPGDGQNDARGGAKPALQPVANHGVANFLGDGEAGADAEIVAATTDEKNETRRRRAPAGIGGDEILACGDDCEGATGPGRAYALSFARPFARRLARTLRPPGVAIRARNP